MVYVLQIHSELLLDSFDLFSSNIFILFNLFYSLDIIDKPNRLVQNQIGKYYHLSFLPIDCNIKKVKYHQNKKKKQRNLPE